MQPASTSAAPTGLATAQGVFNIVAGLWPLVSLRSFEWVFGPKQDRWLEHTVAGLLCVNGATQIAAARSGEPVAARRIGQGTALTLLAIDLVYVPKGRIRWTYLIDGAMEAGWLLAWRRAR